MTRAVRILIVAAFLLGIAEAAFSQGRSFVGNKLPASPYLDTEGHAIRATDYEGSVLVMYGGIPW